MRKRYFLKAKRNCLTGYYDFKSLSVTTCLHANIFLNGIFLSLELWRMHVVAPVSDISLRLCWLLSTTLELIMVDMGFIKAARCTEVGVCYQP